MNTPSLPASSARSGFTVLCAAAALFLLTVPGASAETYVRIVPPEQAAASMAALREGRPSTATGELIRVPDDALPATGSALGVPILPRPERSLQPRTERLARALIVPYYYVDPATSETTLFAVRNASLFNDIQIRVSYLGTRVADGAMRTDELTLSGKEVYSVNVRDVAGLLPDVSGVKKGIIIVQQLTPGDALLSGDYFHINISQNFATGNTMLGQADYCEDTTVRFLNGGPVNGGTNGFLFVLSPKGASMADDPPSAVISFYDEAGVADNLLELYTDQNLLLRNFATLLHFDNFGSYDISFGPDRGMAGVTFSAANKYSIGLHGVCMDGSDLAPF